MGEGSPRSRLGISLEDAAEVIGVSRGTLTMYEANPDRVGDVRRGRIESFYRDLDQVLERARKRRDRLPRRRSTRGSAAPLPVPARPA